MGPRVMSQPLSSSPAPCQKRIPCPACPWVSAEARDKAALTDRVRDAAKRGVYTCHVNLGVCHGAALYTERHARTVRGPGGAALSVKPLGQIEG